MTWHDELMSWDEPLLKWKSERDDCIPGRQADRQTDRQIEAKVFDENKERSIPTPLSNFLLLLLLLLLMLMTVPSPQKINPENPESQPGPQMKTSFKIIAHDEIRIRVSKTSKREKKPMTIWKISSYSICSVLFFPLGRFCVTRGLELSMYHPSYLVLRPWVWALSTPWTDTPWSRIDLKV